MKTLILGLLCITSIAFAKPALKDPRIEAAKKGSAALVKSYTPSTDKLTFVKTTIVEQENNFFITNTIVKVNNVLKSYCLSLQIAITTDDDGKQLVEVGVIENNNDVKDVYIQECTSPPTIDDVTKIKLLNNWTIKN